MQPQSDRTPASPTLRKAWQELHQSAPKGILSSKHLTRRQRERLSTAGYLEPIMRGWYRLKSPGEPKTSVTPTLEFLPIYLKDRLGSRWCLSAESSLVIRMSPQFDPERLVVMAEIGSTTVHTFDSGLRLTIYQDDQQLPTRMENINGFMVMPLDTILGRMTSSQWDRQLPLVDQVLPTISGIETMVWQWLSEERYQAVIRIFQRLKELGLGKSANAVKKCLLEEGIKIPGTLSQDPSINLIADETEITSPVPNQIDDIQEIWQIWSKNLNSIEGTAPTTGTNLLARLSAIEHSIPDDAQNHLALSGYSVPRDAIVHLLAEPEIAADANGWPFLEPFERISEKGESVVLPGDLDPQSMVSMQGYLEALRLVKRSIVRMMEGQDLNRILRQDVRGWRMALMSPSAEAGMITRRQVLRYRDAGPNELNIRKSMENWVDLVASCESEYLRGILAFLGIMKIKPWASGNQRMAFLVLNGLNAAAGYPWIVVNPKEESTFKDSISLATGEGNPQPLNFFLNAHQIS